MLKTALIGSKRWNHFLSNGNFLGEAGKIRRVEMKGRRSCVVAAIVLNSQKRGTTSYQKLD